MSTILANQKVTDFDCILSTSTMKKKVKLPLLTGKAKKLDEIQAVFEAPEIVVTKPSDTG